VGVAETTSCAREGRTVRTTWQRFGTDDLDAQHGAGATAANEWPDALVITATSVRVPREAAAADYARSLPESFDLIHLGLGPDGHTASLVPGDPVLEVMDRGVALTGIYQGRKRMTLTYPTLNAAKQVLWLVTGEDKVDALRRLRAGDLSIPAGRVAAASALIIADAAAAGR